jgi:hypothetical protein
VPGTRAQPAPVPLAEVGLVLADDGSRWLDSAPAEIAVGAIRMQGWQVQPVRPRPDGFDGQDCYLIRVNYDLVLQEGVPAPPWFEVGIAWSCPGTDGPVAVIDAVPRDVLQAQAPMSYTVSEYLSLVPAGGTDGIVLPAATPFIDAFGIGGSEIRWRHASGVRPGSHSALLVLVVPDGCREVTVDVSARFDLSPDDSLGCRPSNRPGRFRLGLTGPPATQPAAALAVAGGAPRHVAPRVPRVFVSYTHDDAKHTEAVRVFSEFLAVDCGLDVHLDRWDLDQPRDWYLWAIDQITKADFVVVIASRMCKLAGDGQMPNDRHLGIQTELSLLRELLHSDRATWRRKLLPVVLPGRSATEIPLFLQPQTADHYRVTGMTAAGAEDLLRVITGRPAYIRPQPRHGIRRSIRAAGSPGRPPATDGSNR